MRNVHSTCCNQAIDMLSCQKDSSDADACVKSCGIKEPEMLIIMPTKIATLTPGQPMYLRVQGRWDTLQKIDIQKRWCARYHMHTVNLKCLISLMSNRRQTTVLIWEDLPSFYKIFDLPDHAEYGLQIILNILFWQAEQNYWWAWVGEQLTRQDLYVRWNSLEITRNHNYFWATTSDYNPNTKLCSYCASR